MVSWQPGPDNGADITWYTVQYNLVDSPDDWFDYYETASGDRREQSIELAPFGTYHFRVVAMNAVGKGLPSDVTSGQCTTPPDRPNRNPRSVRSRTDRKGFLVIEWEVSGGEVPVGGWVDCVCHVTFIIYIHNEFS